MDSSLVEKTSVADYLCITHTKLRTFNFTWELHDASALFEPVTSKFPISSGSGIQWQLKLDFQAENAKYISAELSVLSARELPLSISFKIFILNCERNEYEIARSNQTNIDRLCKGSKTNIIRREKVFIRNGRFLNDNILTLLFEITVISPQNTTIETSFQTISTPDLQLSEDLANLFTSGAHTDVVFEVDGTEIAAHKGILSARSPVFRAMFEHEMKETKTNRVQVQDIDAEVLNELIRFIYTGKIPNLDKISAKMMAAADKYALGTLKKACEKFMYSELTAEIAFETLNIADKYNAQELKAKTLEYIFLHLDATATDEWKQAIQTYPNLALDLVEMCFRWKLMEGQNNT